MLFLMMEIFFACMQLHYHPEGRDLISMQRAKRQETNLLSCAEDRWHWNYTNMLPLKYLYRTYLARRSHSPPGFYSRTEFQCWCPGWTRCCRLDVWQKGSSTGRNVASQSRYPACRGSGGPVSLPAGQHTQSQCTHSEGSTALSLLPKDDMK